MSISGRKIRVLIVDDSSVVRMLLIHLLGSDPQIEIIGTASNGIEAIRFVSREIPPDIVLMDVEMPEMNGYEATRRIMETRPMPVVICGGSVMPSSSVARRAIDAGALACVDKPVGTNHKDYAATVAHLVQTIKLMSEVKVVRRWPRSRRDSAALPCLPVVHPATRVEIVGIGASTGGPLALQTILAGLPASLPVPILIVQHIAPGFVAALGEWLEAITPLKVCIAEYGTQPLPGHVYLAPDDFHMAINSSGRILLSSAPLQNGLRPSVAHLFQSLADVFGCRAAGVLLTGMGKDGACELKSMRDCGAATIVQDRETSVVHGMPGEAIALDAATYVLPVDQIASTLHKLICEVALP
ncbi:MAG TPA: chemotaxis-specific protein-glutamate methyltransferase CheB [Tepidisphaeraceae bacterium]|jgi:two-component system chemotaxis response regulator CheB|nr:chemotaxis-specific protein-glutamate methyltransferase CheB [Tepidisphaeraceae bacterium]